MTQTVVISGRSGRQAAHALIDVAPINSVVKVSAPKRSDDQNALMWAALSDISRCKPMGRTHTPEVWKELFCHACGHAVQFEMGLNGQPFPVGFRTSRMTKDQMAELLTFILAWGDEHGVQWTREAA